MIDLEYERWQEQVDRLLNDPLLPMQAQRIWEAVELLARLVPDPLAPDPASELLAGSD
jgi:hypothetical protein